MAPFLSVVSLCSIPRKETAMSRLSFISVAIAALIMGCDVAQVSDPVFEDTSNPITREEARTLTIESIDAAIRLTEVAGRSKPVSDDSLVVVYVRGDSSGSGAILTEKHQTLKGVRYVEVKRVVGGGSIHPNAVVTTVEKFLSEQHFLEGQSATIRTTALYAEQSGDESWIVTHIGRDGRALRATFKGPIITARDQKVTTRQGSTQGIEVITQEDGVLLKTQHLWGGSDGSVNRRTTYPDSTWQLAKVRGESDGSVARTYTSGP